MLGCREISEVACNLGRVKFSLGLTDDSVLLYSIASEFAASTPNVNGPGTFLSAFVDEINHLSSGDYDWIQKGKLQIWKRS